MRETLAAIALILAFALFVSAVIGGASWVFVRFERYALGRGWIEEEEEVGRR